MAMLGSPLESLTLHVHHIAVSDRHVHVGAT